MNIISWKEFLLPYNQCVDELVIKFKGVENEFKLRGSHSPIEDVQGRVKKIGSILDKAKRKNIPYNEIEGKIEDIAGIRILCKFEDDIFQVVQLIKQREGYDLKIIEQRDYITNMKESGYKSYHLLVDYKLFVKGSIQNVRAEIQIRTLAMNFWATLEHSLNYKYSHNLPDNVKERLRSVAKASYKLDTEMGEIREEILGTIEIKRFKNGLIDEILGRIENLYFNVAIENANELNKQFFDLYEKGDLENLINFNERIKVISQLYNEE